MEGQFFFTTIAGLGVSIAGFAGLVVAVRPDQQWTAVDHWRIRNILGLGFRTAFLALTPIPVFTLTGDLDLTIRITSGIILLAIAIQLFFASRNDPAEWPEGRTAFYLTELTIAVLPNVANLWLASVGLLQLILIQHLFHPANIFFLVILEVVRAQKQRPKETAK